MSTTNRFILQNLALRAMGLTKVPPFWLFRENNSHGVNLGYIPAAKTIPDSTGFGMGLLVIVFMASQGYYAAPLIGLIGACCGCVCSTRLMQRFVLKAYPQYATEDAVSAEDIEEEKEEDEKSEKTVFIRLLNAMLDGGRSGVEVGVAIIPGVLIISTFVMIFTFGAGADGTYNGSAYQGVELLPWLANKVDFVFEWLFGFHDPHLVAFPITALGAVGAALLERL